MNEDLTAKVVRGVVPKGEAHIEKEEEVGDAERGTRDPRQNS